MRTFQENLLVLIASGLIIFAPLFRSGKTSLALMTMELIGIALLLIIFWGNLAKDRLEKPIRWFLVGSLLCALAYLIPLPHAVREQLPGRTFYAEHLAWLNTSYSAWSYQALSLIPIRTIAGLLALLAPLALFLTAISLPARKVTWLILVLLLTAFSQAILSMGQYFIQDQDLFFRVWSGGVPLGTYINQNHLVAFMEMVEPLAIGLMMMAILSQNLGITLKIILATLFGLISLALTFTPLLTTSRMGAALLIVSILLSFWAMTTPEIRKKVAAPIFALRFVLLILAIVIQLNVLQQIVTITYVDRLAPQAALGDLRWVLYSTTFEAIQNFFPLGSGPGTTPQVYQLYQPTTINAFVNHTHNDFIELMLDMGIFGLLIICLLMFFYIRRWRQLWQDKSSGFKLLQTGAGVGILLALLYSFTDFGLHTPANAIFFAFLFGVFLHKEQLT
ncbi:O-antigen ligase [uncultured Thiothrix sp.]|uniref:O-antigen ligase family protein n=1 Tax=uncultured Thiothrix sp. TaxID=223185 RepID=UPI00263787BF|nr:O-antigen ligase family protein [uncultured Thiothrix sp.]HMT94504.1 O-antigen ligase family protein [Thiolinea sp.]